MRGFFRSLEPFLRIGLGLFVLAVIGALAQIASHWIPLPLFVVLEAVGVIAVLTMALIVGIAFLKS